MKKFIEVRKNRQEDQAVISQWLVSCQSNNIPAIIVYYHNETAYISASILNLVTSSEFTVEVDTDELDKRFEALAASNISDGLRYWNHNGRFFTFDDIPKAKAPALATEIFDILQNSLAIQKVDKQEG